MNPWLDPDGLGAAFREMMAKAVSGDSISIYKKGKVKTAFVKSLEHILRPSLIKLIIKTPFGPLWGRMASPNLALPSICHRPVYVTGRKGSPSHNLKNVIT